MLSEAEHSRFYTIEQVKMPLSKPIKQNLAAYQRDTLRSIANGLRSKKSLSS